MAASVAASVAIGNSLAALTTLETASFTLSGSNRVIYALVGAGAESPGDPTSVRFASTAGVGGELFTLLDSVRNYDAGLNIKTSVWRLANPSAASGTIHATYAAANDERWIIAVQVQDAAGTEGTITFANGNTNAPTVNAASTAGELVLDFLTYLDGGGAGRTVTVDASQTSIRELEGTGTGSATSIGPYEGAGVSSEIAAGASTTMSWSLGGAVEWGIHTFRVNPYVAVAGAGLNIRRRNTAILLQF